MGAFYISDKNRTIPESVYKIFQKKGFKKPKHLFINDIQILLYQKQRFDSINEISIGISKLFVIGTCFYKNLNYQQGLDNILKDYISNNFDADKLIGSYFLLFFHNNKIEFFSDRESVQNIFFHSSNKIISSSFLAIIAGSNEISGKLKLNKEALAEVLITGNLIGPETLVEDIFRFEPALHDNLPGLPRLKPVELKEKTKSNNTFQQEVIHQQNILQEYFESIKTNLDELGALSGLTGGFDSRLLYIHLRKATNNFTMFSTSRETPTLEFICASNLAKEAGDTIYSPEHKPAEKLETEGFLNLLNDNMHFNDGMIRTHQLWTEEIKSRDYLINLYKEKKIGFSGVGGEQYRNSEYLIKNKYSFKSWIYYELIYRHTSDIFTNSIEKNKAIDKLKKKITTILGLKDNENKISGLNIKKYYNEIYNPGNRIIRNNIENQMIFFLSPFTEFAVSKDAYNAFPFLGSNHLFEKEMIRYSAPELAKVKLDYGFAISEKIPIKFKALPIIKWFFGLNLFHRIAYSITSNKSNKNFNKIINAHPGLEKYLLKLEDVGLPIKIDLIKKNNYLSPLLFEAGYFLTEMENFIEYD